MNKAAYQGLVKILAKMTSVAVQFSIDSLSAEDDRVVAEARSKGVLINGEDYANTYVFVFRIREGRIAHIAEHFNALLVQEKLIPLMRR